MKPLVFALITVMLLSSLIGCRHSRVVPAEVTDTEYQVLSAYTGRKFKSVVGVEQIVIQSETQSMTDNLDEISDVNKVLALRRAHGQLFRAFFEVNRYSSSFHRSFTLPVPYQIADSLEMRSIFGTPGDVWGRYYEKYPNSQGLLVFSRVGFSPDGRQAGFYFSNRCGGLCGAAYFAIMEKQGVSDWRVLQEVQLWIS